MLGKQQFCIASSILFLLSVGFAIAADAPLQGGYTPHDIANFRCAAGQGVNNGFQPLANGEVCLRTPVGDNEALGLECDGIKDPVVISKCDASKCVAKIGCDGKPLTGAPTPPTQGGSDPLKPTPTPNPTTPSSPTPSIPSTGSGSVPMPLPGNTGSGSTGGVSGPGPVQNPDGSYQLPEVVVGQNPNANPVKPTVPTGPSSNLTPGGSVGGVGGVGSDLGSGPFIGSGTAFGSSFGSSVGNGNVSGNLMASFFSQIFTNLFSGLFNFSGSGSVNGNGIANTQPPRVAQNIPTQPDRVPLPPGLDAAIGAIGEMQGEQPVSTSGTGVDRTGLENVFPQQDSGSITGPRPNLPGAIRQEDLMNPDDDPPPEDTRPIRIIDVAQVTDPGVSSDVGGIAVPHTTTPNSPDTTVQARTRVNAVFTGLANGTIQWGSQDVADARAILERDVRIAKQTLEREHLTRSLPFREWVDSAAWLPDFIKSDEYLAVKRAENELNALGEAEGLARIGELAGNLESATPRPGIIEVTNEEIDTTGFRSIPTPLEAARAIRNWWTGSSEVQAALPPTPAPAVTPIDPTPAPAPAPEVPPAPTPVVGAQPYGLLDGLSAVAERVYEVGEKIAVAVGLKTPAPSPAPAPTPAPVPSSNPQPAPQPSNAFMRSGMNLLSTLMSGLANLFGGGSGSSSNPTPAAVPNEVTAVASITANPVEVAAGASTRLAWSSVHAERCVVVDAQLSVIARGNSGATSTPALTQTTRFGIICDIQGGSDKFLNEVLVRVKGGASTTPPLFSNSGRASTASNVGISGGVGIGGSTASTSAPIDVRTCEPEQSIDTFIACLCEAEPHPNGCSMVQ